MSDLSDADFTVKICHQGGSGLFLPLSSSEWTWPAIVRGPMYGFAMAYCFLGVSIVADTFMSAIEAVTSRRRKVRLKDGRVITARVWNDTVANLTLMALGSSAPEILLSVIELLKRDMYAGELGPSTIVGSAAFNLFVIVALCIVVIPSDEYRQVKELSVLYITVVFSLFAYIWLVVILSLITPNVVDFWEAFVTFLCFPLLVYTSWLADTGKLGRLMRRRQSVLVGPDCMADELFKSIVERVGAKDEQTVEVVRKHITDANLGSEPSTIELEALVNSLKPQVRSLNSAIFRKSRATHRIEAIRAFTGSGKRIHTRRGSAPQSSVELPSGVGHCEHDGNEIMFTCDRQWLSGNLSEKPISLARIGDINFDVKVEYAVYVFLRDKSMQCAPSVLSAMACNSQANLSSSPSVRFSAAEAYAPNAEESSLSNTGRETSSGTFVFRVGETRADILVERPPCILPGQSEDFLVRLKNVEAVEGARNVTVGPIASTTVIIAAERAAGHFAFAQEWLNIQATTEVQKTQALVVRKAGCCGAVSVHYHTEKLTALPGFDYSEASGVLDFADGETEQTIELEILPKGPSQGTDEFLVLLEDPVGGATFDPQDNGGEECSQLIVTIGALDATASRSNNIIRWIDNKVLNIAEFRVGTEDWKDQFAGAVYCNGSREEQAEASSLDWTFHLVSLPWKLLFTLVPPTTFFNGWLCFYTSLAMIGIVTGVIGDLAELFGCVLDLPDAVTAITFVALGTSMPDLFASQSAAMQDPWADASICNVTGSNSVNVFLGLGLPWTFGAIHWNVTKRSTAWESRYPDVAKITPVGDTVFVVEAKSLGFSVLVYACASLSALGILQLRRNRLGFELGGPWLEKVTSAMALVALWFAYLVLASWQVLRKSKASDSETYAVIISVLAIVSFFVMIPVVILCRYKAPLDEGSSHSEVEADAKTKTMNGIAVQQDVRRVDRGSASIEKDPFVVAPPGMATGMPMLKGFHETSTTVRLELSQEFRSPPLTVITEFDMEFGDRPVAQPPFTPGAKVDLMMETPLPVTVAAQDSLKNGFARDVDQRLAPGDLGSYPPVVHLPNVTCDAALLDPQEGGARRMPSPCTFGNSDPQISIGPTSGSDCLKRPEVLLAL